MMSVEDPVIPILLGRINVPVKRIQQAVSAALQEDLELRKTTVRSGLVTRGKFCSVPWLLHGRPATNT